MPQASLTVLAVWQRLGSADGLMVRVLGSPVDREGEANVGAPRHIRDKLKVSYEGYQVSADQYVVELAAATVSLTGGFASSCHHFQAQFCK